MDWKKAENWNLCLRLRTTVGFHHVKLLSSKQRHEKNNRTVVEMPELPKN